MYHYPFVTTLLTLPIFLVKPRLSYSIYLMSPSLLVWTIFYRVKLTLIYTNEVLGLPTFHFTSVYDLLKLMSDS